MLQQIVRVRRNATPAAIHDLRVATRRLQESLDFFEPYLPPLPRRRLFRRARRIRRELGDLRNADVMLELIRSAGRRLEGADPGILQEWCRRLAAEASALRRRSSGRAGIPVPGARRRCRFLGGPLGSPGTIPPGERGRDMLGLRSREVSRRIPPALTGDASALHRLRIAVKRYRYALEILLKLGHREAEEWIASARAVQDELGRIHDLDVLGALLRREPRSPAAKSLRVRLEGERANGFARARALLADFHPEEAGRAVLGAAEGTP
jgi:CHAD domain-containing protein